MAWLDLDPAPGARREAAPRPAILAALVALLLPAAAGAQDFRLVREDPSTFACVSMQACDVAGDACNPGGLVLDGDVCTALPDGSGQACMRPGTPDPNEIFCCATSDDCGVLPSGHVGTCVPFSVESDAGLVGVCNYGLYEYCGDPGTIDPGVVRACLTDSLSGNLLQDYRNGDCDGDGIPNVNDPCICDVTNSCLGPSDGGPIFDAGTGGSRGPSFTGAGGCTVAPSAGSSGSLVWVLLAPVVAAFARRRRRRV